MCGKLGITAAEGLQCLELVFKLAYTKSSKEFDTHWAEIKATKLNSVIEYLELNWLPIKHHWVACFKDEALIHDELCPRKKFSATKESEVSLES